MPAWLNSLIITEPSFITNLSLSPAFSCCLSMYSFILYHDRLPLYLCFNPLATESINLQYTMTPD